MFKNKQSSFQQRNGPRGLQKLQSKRFYHGQLDTIEDLLDPGGESQSKNCEAVLRLGSHRYQEQLDRREDGGAQQRHVSSSQVNLKRKNNSKLNLKFRVNPNGSYKITWDKFIALSVIYVAVQMPWALAFASTKQDCIPSCVISETTCKQNTLNAEVLQIYQQRYEATQFCHDGNLDAMHLIVPEDQRYQVLLPCYPNYLKIIDGIVNGLFALDMILVFFTGVQLPRTNEINYNFKTISRTYLRGWFVIDLLATVPLDDFIQLFWFQDSGMLGLQFFKIFRLLRLNRVMRQLSVYFNPNLVRIIQMVGSYGLAAHLLGCLFFFLGRFQMENIKGGGMNVFTGDPWIAANCLQLAIGRTQYSMSLYFSLTTLSTVGYGDISPITNIEKNFIMAVMILGGIFQAIIFGNVTLLISNFDTATGYLREQLAQLQSLIDMYRIPPSLAQRLKDSVEYKWNINHGIDINKTLAIVPTYLSNQVQVEQHKDIFLEAPFFKDISKPLLQALSQCFQNRVYIPDDIIVEAEEYAIAIYIILDGYCRVLSRNRKVEYCTLGPKDIFGELECILAEKVISTVQTQTYCSCLILDRDDLLSVLNDFPDEEEKLMQQVLQRREILRQANVATVRSICNNYNGQAAVKVMLEHQMDTLRAHKNQVRVQSKPKQVPLGDQQDEAVLSQLRQKKRVNRMSSAENDSSLRLWQQRHQIFAGNRTLSEQIKALAAVEEPKIKPKPVQIQPQQIQNPQIDQLQLQRPQSRDRREQLLRQAQQLNTQVSTISSEVNQLNVQQVEINILVGKLCQQLVEVGVAEKTASSPTPGQHLYNRDSADHSRHNPEADDIPGSLDIQSESFDWNQPVDDTSQHM